MQACELVHDRHARLEWQRLLVPAERAARDGYPASHAGARYLAITADALFAPDPEAYGILTGDDGELLAGGEITTNRPWPTSSNSCVVTAPRSSRPARSAARWSTRWPRRVAW